MFVVLLFGFIRFFALCVSLICLFTCTWALNLTCGCAGLLELLVATYRLLVDVFVVLIACGF